MRPLSEFSSDARRRIGSVLCDIDDTLTLDGRLPAVACGLDFLGRVRAGHRDQFPSGTHMTPDLRAIGNLATGVAKSIGPVFARPI